MSGVRQSSSVATQVHRRIRGWRAGRVFVPRDFVDLGSRMAVDTTLHRLLARGAIRRHGRGLYDRPRLHPRLGLLDPGPDDLADALARTTGETLVHSGAMAANLLGLSTQVPARPVYLTSGATRDVDVGRVRLRFKHAAPRHMAGGNSRPGLVLRALRYLGKDAIDSARIARMRSVLTAADRRRLKSMRSHAPAWMHPVLDQVVLGGPDIESADRMMPNSKSASAD